MSSRAASNSRTGFISCVRRAQLRHQSLGRGLVVPETGPLHQTIDLFGAGLFDRQVKESPWRCLMRAMSSAVLLRSSPSMRSFPRVKKNARRDPEDRAVVAVMKRGEWRWQTVGRIRLESPFTE